LDLSSGTPFQISVWRALLKIPYGKVTTYGAIAKRVSNPQAARAVGNAVGANPIPIIVPCHRVVATNGLGGYSCGIEIKKSLLGTEGILQ
jgi:methylated-DNA-[protein]-cysteine S-methyltransferase